MITTSNTGLQWRRLAQQADRMVCPAHEVAAGYAHQQQQAASLQILFPSQAHDPTVHITYNYYYHTHTHTHTLYK